MYWLTSVHMLAQHSLAKSSGMSTAIAMMTGSLTMKRCTADEAYEHVGMHVQYVCVSVCVQCACSVHAVHVECMCMCMCSVCVQCACSACVQRAPSVRLACA